MESVRRAAIRDNPTMNSGFKLGIQWCHLRSVGKAAWCATAILLGPPSCKRDPTTVAPLPQRAYVWQRDWNPAVIAAIHRSHRDLTGYVILACEIEWHDGHPRSVIPAVDWAALRTRGIPVSPAIRVMPGPVPVAADDATARFLCEIARQRLAVIRAAGIDPAELQLDFDCPQRKLGAYAKWVGALRQTISPLPLIITTLPCWLDESGFPGLVRAASGYVLQVHSVALPPGVEHAMVCDPALARAWTIRAAAIGVPFAISLPTYRITAGYDACGRKIGAYSDAIRPPWPPGTSIREYATDLDAMAALVAAWQAHPPAHCTGLLWYRLPVDGDRQNCPWPALRALTCGRPPARSCEVRVNDHAPDPQDSLSLADLSVVNTGETDEINLAGVSVKWNPPANPALVEPLPGWKITRGDHELTFHPTNRPTRLRLGAICEMGWLRFENPARIHVQILSEAR